MGYVRIATGLKCKGDTDMEIEIRPGFSVREEFFSLESVIANKDANPKKLEKAFQRVKANIRDTVFKDVDEVSRVGAGPGLDVESYVKTLTDLDVFTNRELEILTNKLHAAVLKGVFKSIKFDTVLKKPWQNQRHDKPKEE